MTLNFCQRLIFFLLSIHLISFHRFTLKEEFVGRARGKGAVERPFEFQTESRSRNL